jgi:hypothetical protein
MFIWRNSAKTFGVLFLIAVGLFYYWSEQIADPGRLHGAKQIEVRSGAGAMDIVGVEGGDISFSIDGEPNNTGATRVNIDRGHFPTRVQISGLPEGHRLTLKVPADASLSVSMSAGELRISGMKGDIESLLRSGRTQISVDDSRQFKSADASVLAGDIQAPAFKRHKGGMFRRFVWAGGGQNLLRAHVTTGQLVLR